MAKRRDYRSDTGRGGRKLTRKEILWQLGLCVAILLFFAIKDTFFPSGAATATPTPIQSITVEQKSGEAALDTSAVLALEIELPVVDGNWRIFVVDWEGSVSYTLLSSNVSDLSMDNLSRPGYDVGESARINVVDTDAMAALLQLVPTGDSVMVIGANGIAVDNTTYALLADGARKSGLSVGLGEWSGDVVTPSPTADATPSE